MAGYSTKIELKGMAWHRLRHCLGMFGGTEENHEILQPIQAVSGPKYETRPTKYIVQLLLT
jgi:predicted Zn-dependent protease